ncbi:MAG: four helix bundle protein [Candidatus Kerfeldbacteria bacterium]|nr:four helix bundle protein [Candidatus Kerfeldbacteria bacterium]
MKIVSFTDLDAWKQSHQLVITIYQATQNFPGTEMFGLVSQMRRSAVSVTSNLAEGFSRYSFKEKVQFYRTSLGSLTELENQLLVAKDVGFLDQASYLEIRKRTTNAHKLINGLIRSSRLRVSGSANKS